MVNDSFGEKECNYFCDDKTKALKSIIRSMTGNIAQSSNDEVSARSLQLCNEIMYIIVVVSLNSSCNRIWCVWDPKGRVMMRSQGRMIMRQSDEEKEDGVFLH